MLSCFLSLYIEFDSATKEVLIPVLFGVIFILLMFFGIKATNNNPDYTLSRDSQIPLNLLRAHLKQFIFRTDHNYDELKHDYSEYLKKYGFLNIDIKYELNQLHYLIENKVDVNQTISKGVNETHKKKLLILFFLFKVALKPGKISDKDRQYLDKIHFDLGITESIYIKVRSIYLRSYNITYDHNICGSITEYKLQKAYKSLNLSRNSNFNEVKKAYRLMVKKFHPDTLIENDSISVEYALNKFNEVIEAYEILKEYRNKP